MPSLCLCVCTDFPFLIRRLCAHIRFRLECFERVIFVRAAAAAVAAVINVCVCECVSHVCMCQSRNLSINCTNGIFTVDGLCTNIVPSSSAIAHELVLRAASIHAQHRPVRATRVSENKFLNCARRVCVCVRVFGCEFMHQWEREKSNAFALP